MAAEDPPDLPGFYYDREKGKYFKVIKSHQSTGAGYTAEKAAQKDSEMQQNAQKALSHGRLHRSLAFRHPLHGDLGLHRELGSVERCRSQSLAWAAGLSFQNSWNFRIPCDDGVFKRLNQFIYDSAVGAVIEISGLFAICETFGTRFLKRGWIRGHWPGNASSMSLSPSRALLVTSFSEGTRPSRGYIHFLKRPDDLFGSYMRSHTSQSKHLNRKLPVDVEDPSKAAIHFTMERSTQVFASAANPLCNAASFVIASSHGIHFLSCGEDFYLSPPLRVTSASLRSGTCRALDWLSENVAVSGSQDGRVCLWDRRVKAGANRVSVQSGISHCRRLNEHSVVVASLSNHLASYDLRFTKVDESQPYITYSGYKNRGYIRLGFDVCSDGSLIAAANYDTSFTIFDSALETGIPLTVRKFDYPYPHDGTRSINCLKFVENLCDYVPNTEIPKKRKPKHARNIYSSKLLVANGDELDFWSW